VKHEVEVILASKSAEAPPIYTMRLRYPRMVHSEVMTHRVFSRNASSSRAIPVSKFTTSTSEDDWKFWYIPSFRKNQPGMMPGNFLTPDDQREAEDLWIATARDCVDTMSKLAELGVHKQWVNRIGEWFGFINVLITSTEWDNFFELRTETNPDGTPVPQDEIYELACSMKLAMENCEVKKIRSGEWHLPYVTDDEKDSFSIAQLKKMSAARCASISYQTVDGKPMNWEKAISLCDKLLEKKHYSPFEHQAMADAKIDGSWCHKSWHGNFTGWVQWRHVLASGSKA
jgi:hypothetical protein